MRPYKGSFVFWVFWEGSLTSDLMQVLLSECGGIVSILVYLRLAESLVPQLQSKTSGLGQCTSLLNSTTDMPSDHGVLMGANSNLPGKRRKGQPLATACNCISLVHISKTLRRRTSLALAARDCILVNEVLPKSWVWQVYSSIYDTYNGLIFASFDGNSAGSASGSEGYSMFEAQVLLKLQARSCALRFENFEKEGRNKQKLVGSYEVIRVLYRTHTKALPARESM
jgi:hypothetical protein